MGQIVQLNTIDRLHWIISSYFSPATLSASQPRFSRAEAAVLLGHVMTHEVGHLLLGAAHTPETIMAEGLGSRDFPLMKAGRVRFNQRQAERLRSAVAVHEGVWQA